MKSAKIAVVIAALFMSIMATAAGPIGSITKEWTYSHALTGVAVLNAPNASLVQHINTSSFGSINSVAIKNGLAAFAIESSVKTNTGIVQLYGTSSRSLSSGINTIAVGALLDMLTFTADGSKLLVANEGTPSTYGARIGTTVPRNYAPAAVDPVGSVSIINMSTRTVTATPGFVGVTQTGSNIRTNTGMDFEPEYIAVNAA